jgi:hypothetical protein
LKKKRRAGGKGYENDAARFVVRVAAGNFVGKDCGRRASGFGAG